MDIDRVDVTLRGCEQVVSGSGTNRTTHHHEIHESKVTLTAGRAARAGERVDIEARVPIPSDAPGTFMADDNALLWGVVVHISISGWPDWKREYAIVVEP